MKNIKNHTHPIGTETRQQIVCVWVHKNNISRHDHSDLSDLEDGVGRQRERVVTSL